MIIIIMIRALLLMGTSVLHWDQNPPSLETVLAMPVSGATSLLAGCLRCHICWVFCSEARPSFTPRSGRNRFGSIRFASDFSKIIGSVRFVSEEYVSRFDLIVTIYMTIIILMITTL